MKTTTFYLGDHVRKTKGSQWKGRVVGTYSTDMTPEGCVVESDTEKGSVQACPAAELEFVAWEDSKPDVTQLVEALMACTRASSAAEVGLIVDAALAAYRKGGTSWNDY